MNEKEKIQFAGEKLSELINSISRETGKSVSEVEDDLRESQPGLFAKYDAAFEESPDVTELCFNRVLKKLEGDVNKYSEAYEKFTELVEKTNSKAAKDGNRLLLMIDQADERDGILLSWAQLIKRELPFDMEDWELLGALKYMFEGLEISIENGKVVCEPEN